MGSVKDALFDNKLVKVSTGEYNKQKIYQYIVKYATPKQGIYPHEIVKSVDISPKPTRQTVQNHLRELIKEEKVYKQNGQYFPSDWNLSAILLFASFMRQNAIGFIDPYPVIHKHTIHQEKQTPRDQLFKRTTGISVSHRYCKINLTGKKQLLKEKYLFEYVNRIGAFITYIFIESMRPRQNDSSSDIITDEIKKDMSRNLIFNSVSIADLFDRFCLFLNDMQILTKEIPVSLELHKENIDPVELDNATFDKVSEVFRNVYLGIYEGIEKFWFSSRQYWDKIGSRIAKIKGCEHKWQKVYIYKYKKSYECIKCHIISDSKIESIIPENNDRIKRKSIENLTSDDLDKISIEDLNKL
jgi:hypothetical protein